MVAVILGEVSLPSPQEAEDYMVSIIKEGMRIHYVRSYIDCNYKKLLCKFEGKIKEEMEGKHWSWDCTDARTVHFLKEAQDLICFDSYWYSRNSFEGSMD